MTEDRSVMSGNTSKDAATSSHKHIVLFYKYFLPDKYPLLHTYPRYYEEQLERYQKQLCQNLQLKGRVLLAGEGVNGTLSASSDRQLQEYIDTLSQFELVKDCGLPPLGQDKSYENNSPERLFEGIDWKISTSDNVIEPFPDLKIQIVKEIISTGNAIPVQDIPQLGGQHLSPSEFHQAIVENDNVVLIDVRNTFEYDIGHFVNPKTDVKAINPETVTFSSFDNFCGKNADDLKDKKVLMYCTGGIRCEKASVMLKKRGVDDVSQLSGGIHRYLEEYGENGLFKGLNFVFDQRVAMSPAECQQINNSRDLDHTVVGGCLECAAPFDEISGSRICTVCRDLVLVCPSCRASLREYHCRRHQTWKDCYFTFLEIFDERELATQHEQLSALRDSYTNKNIRRTLQRQMDKVQARMRELKSGDARVERHVLRRCRSCMETSDVCNGLCWGFWKTQQRAESNHPLQMTPLEPLLPIAVGETVKPGPHWNTLRYGSKILGDGRPRLGRVVECKSWGAGGTEDDCVVVVWNDDVGEKSQPYRWGVVGLNGTRLYDLVRHIYDIPLALSYISFYHGNTTTINVPPEKEPKKAKVVSSHQKAPNTSSDGNDNVWESFDWDPTEEAEVIQSLENSQDRCRINASLANKVQKDNDAWDSFYSSHQTNFFKDRHYLGSAFPQEFGSVTKPQVLVEVGCGVGNALLPILEEDNSRQEDEKLWTVYGLDLSSVAIELLKQDERFKQASRKGHAFAFAKDIVQGVPQECLQVGDVASLLFCLSAIDPELQLQAVRNVASIVKPGGTIVFRDYGRLDESQVKLGSQRSKMMKENFYVKHDATKCYFFTTNDLERLFRDQAGLEVLELEYIRRIYRNRSTGATRKRVWVQGRFRKRN